MPQAKTIMLYQYGELSDAAKETARQWWIEAMDSSDYESTIDDFVTIAGLMGVDIAYHSARTMGGYDRQFPSVYWSLGYSQSDYAAFEASYAYRKGSAKLVRDYAPQDTTLHAIVDALQAAQAKTLYKATASIRENRGGMSIEVGEAPFSRDAFDRWSAEVETPVRDAIRDLGRWLYDSIRREHEYLTSDEQVADAMEANEYTFREDGTRED